MSCCPNLRQIVDKKGFFTGSSHYECSCTHERLNGSYVANVCNVNFVTGGAGDHSSYWSRSKAEQDSIDNRYKTCNHYKRYGIRN